MNRLMILSVLQLVTILTPVSAQNSVGFDRLFTNSATRNQLDQSREQYTAIGPVTDEEDYQETMFPKIELKGLIVRNNGSSDIWLNGSSTLGKDNLSREIQSVAKRINREQVQVTLPDGNTVKLKPGQIYTPDSQKILDVYQTAFPVEQEPASIEANIAEQQEQDSEKSIEEKKGEEFDESVLAETDTRIKLLEERLQKLEEQR